MENTNNEGQNLEQEQNAEQEQATNDLEKLENEQDEKLEQNKELEEQKEKAEVKYTDKDVDKIISRVIAKEREAKEKALQEITEAEKMKNLTEDEKAVKRMKELEEQIEKLTRENHTKEMAKVTRNILAEQGINAPDELINTLISDTAEDTKEKVKAFTDTFNTMLDKAVNERLGGRKAPNFVGGTPSLSLKDLENLSTKDRIKVIQENPDIYK